MDAASGTQIGASLKTQWSGIPVFTALAWALLAALIAFVALVEHAPVQRVAAVVVARGRPAEAGLPPFTVAPQGDPLVVKLLVTPAAEALVRPGVEFRLAFSAYPQERFGLFAAKIDSVDQPSSMSGAVEHAARTAGPMVIAFASLPGTLRGPHGETLPLAPGMVAQALVPTTRRTVLEALLDPVLRGLADAGRPHGGAAETRR